MFTPEDIARLRAVAEADRDGADGRDWDEAVTPKIVIALCDELEQARPLTWTKEPPKVPGWYWCRGVDRETRLRKVENVVGGPRLFVCGISSHIFPDDLTDIEWAGPIPEPREQK